MHSQVETTLTTSLNGRRYTHAPNINVCPDDVINFNCVVKGARILAWISDQYIGTGGTQLELTDTASEGHEERSDVDPNVVATLTSTDSNRRTLTSTLHIIVASSDNISNSTIVCDQRNTNGTAASVTLYYLGKGYFYIL